MVKGLKLALYNWNSCLDEVVEKLKKKHTLLEDYKDADRVVLWNECRLNGWKERVIESQNKGKKVIFYQSGVWGVDWIRPPFNEGMISDVVCVWGEGDKKRMISGGVPAEKIVITGSPIVERLRPRVKHEGKNVVFALEHWDAGDVVENNIVAAELRKLKDVKIITKGLIQENITEVFDNPVFSSRMHSDHMNIVADILTTADLVVAISESTFAFLAETLDIPVIIADIWLPKPRAGDRRYLDYKGNFSNAVTKVKLEDLNKTIMHQLKYPEILQEERKQASIMNGGIDIKDPVQNLIDVIGK